MIFRSSSFDPQSTIGSCNPQSAFCKPKSARHSISSLVNASSGSTKYSISRSSCSSSLIIVGDPCTPTGPYARGAPSASVDRYGISVLETFNDDVQHCALRAGWSSCHGAALMTTPVRTPCIDKPRIDIKHCRPLTPFVLCLPDQHSSFDHRLFGPANAVWRKCQSDRCGRRALHKYVTGRGDVPIAVEN